VNIYVSVDMEGGSGIVLPDQVRQDAPLYQEARRYLTGDVNACVRGLFRGGAKRVTVRDAHVNGFNLIWSELDSRVEVMQGRAGNERFPGLARCDGMVLLGYHAMAGTPGAILEHTMSSKGWQNFWMNGQLCGEVAIDAAVAGEVGVPILMVSGDDKVCREAKALIPHVVIAQVKTGVSCSGGILLSKEKAHAVIEAKSVEAVECCINRTIKPFVVKTPVRMRLELVSRGVVPDRGNKPYLKVIDGRTYEVTGKSVVECLARL
jgi:D-amino peptidase